MPNSPPQLSTNILSFDPWIDKFSSTKGEEAWKVIPRIRARKGVLREHDAYSLEMIEEGESKDAFLEVIVPPHLMFW